MLDLHLILVYEDSETISSFNNYLFSQEINHMEKVQEIGSIYLIYFISSMGIIALYLDKYFSNILDLAKV